MFQVDSYRIDVAALPEFPRPEAAAAAAAAAAAREPARSGQGGHARYRQPSSFGPCGGRARGRVARHHDRRTPRGTRALFEEWVAPLRRLDVYHAVGHMHMSDAVFAYLPEERIIMEGDFTDETWDWWAGALAANIERYGLDPELDIPVHGAVAPVRRKLERTAEQVENARAFCAELAANGRYLLGCPVQYSTAGPL